MSAVSSDTEYEVRIFSTSFLVEAIVTVYDFLSTLIYKRIAFL